jgi:hypothetical protein
MTPFPEGVDGASTVWAEDLFPPIIRRLFRSIDDDQCIICGNACK